MEIRSKNELIEKANHNLNILLELVETLPENILNQEMNFPGKVGHWQRDKFVRDVITHLYEWNKLFLEWVKSNIKGVRRNYLPNEYTWSDYSGLNMKFFEKHQETSLTKAIVLLRESHGEVMKIVDTFTEKDLFEVNALDWVLNGKFAEYIDETTRNHYLWAIDKVKKHFENNI